MITRIVLTGSECTGKSTLASALADHFAVRAVPEFLRSYCDIHGFPLTLDDAVPIAQGQLYLELEAERQAPALLICDSSLLASVVYNNHYYGKNPEQIEYYLAIRKYHHYFLCDIDVPWKNDGQRDHPHRRKYMQHLFHNELCARELPYTILQGSIDHRVNTAVKKIAKLLDDARNNTNSSVIV